MKKYIVEMAVGYCASLEVEAETELEAIEKAKETVLDNAMDYYDGNLEVEFINFIKEIN